MGWQTKSLKASLFRPSTSLSGDEPPTVLRGENAVLRGPQGQQYFEVFPGNRDLGENYNLASGGFALTGTIATTADSAVITGTSTLFRDELHIGQLILATNGEVFAVKEVTSQTSFIAYNTALASTSGLTAYRLPQLFEIERKRGVLMTGKAIEFASGHKIAVGSGTLYINGAVLPGTSLVATKTPQVAIYDPATETYSVKPLGFASKPPPPVITVLTSGGTKRIPVGTKKSFKIAYWTGEPGGTGGHGNACDPVKLTGTSTVIEVSNINGCFQFDFTTSMVGMPSHAKGFIIYESLAGKEVTAITSGGGTTTVSSPNESNYDHGPWYKAAKVKIYSTTFAVSDVNTTTDRVTIANHPFKTGEKVYLSATTTALSITGLGAPITATTPAWVIKIDKDTIAFATTQDLALLGTAADITSAGSGTHTIGYLSAGDLYFHEALDAELYEQETGDNFPPPDSEFVAKLDSRAAYFSCFGKATVSSPTGSSPGPYVQMSKVQNPDGCPPEWTAGGEYNIIGIIEAVGRVFTMTPSSLDFVTSTGLIGSVAQGGLSLELPLIWRPYWKTGAANRYSIIIDDDTLYGRSGGKFFRSIGNGDENVRKYDFGSVVEDVTRDWNDGFTYAVRNPKDGQVCFIRSAAYKNSNGYWVSEIWPFSVWSDAWLPKIVISADDRDMIICGVATIDEKFEFLAGGRAPLSTFQVRTYRFGDGAGANKTIPWYVVWQVTDDNIENAAKRIHSIQPTGKLTSPVFQIHGARPGQRLSVTNMETGSGTDTQAYFSGNISMSTTTQLTDYLQKPVRISGLSNYAVRISGTWDTDDAVKDRLDEVVMEVSSHGRER